MSDGFNAVDGELTLSLEGQAVGSIANNLTTDVEGYALDARQGKVLDEKKLDVSKLVNNHTTVLEGYALDARQGKWLDENKVGFDDVANDLATNDKNKVLSAAQGKALDEKKLDVSNVIDNLTTNEQHKALSAAQGVLLKGMLDGKVQTRSVSLAAGSWSSLRQTVNVSGVTAGNIVLVTPAPASYTVYHGCGVFCSSQGNGTLTFSAVNQPDTALSVQILLIS